MQFILAKQVWLVAVLEEASEVAKHLTGRKKLALFDCDDARFIIYGTRTHETLQHTLPYSQLLLSSARQELHLVAANEQSQLSKLELTEARQSHEYDAALGLLDRTIDLD